MAVGSGAAMDLAKTVATHCQMSPILIPATYGSILAAAQPHSLLLDTTEQALVPRHCANTESTLVMDTAILTNIYRKKQSMHASQFEWMHFMEKATARKRHNC